MTPSAYFTAIAIWVFSGLAVDKLACSIMSEQAFRWLRVGARNRARPLDGPAPTWFDTKLYNVINDEKSLVLNLSIWFVALPLTLALVVYGPLQGYYKIWYTFTFVGTIFVVSGVATFAEILREYPRTRFSKIQDEHNTAINTMLAEIQRLREELLESEKQRSRLLNQRATESVAHVRDGRLPLLEALLAQGSGVRIITTAELGEMEGAILHPPPAGLNGLTEDMFNEVLSRVELHTDETDVRKREDRLLEEVVSCMRRHADTGAFTEGYVLNRVCTYMNDAATAHVRRVASGRMTREYSRVLAWEKYGPHVAPRPAEPASDDDETTTTH